MWYVFSWATNTATHYQKITGDLCDLEVPCDSSPQLYPSWALLLPLSYRLQGQLHSANAGKGQLHSAPTGVYTAILLKEGQLHSTLTTSFRRRRKRTTSFRAYNNCRRGMKLSSPMELSCASKLIVHTHIQAIKLFFRPIVPPENFLSYGIKLSLQEKHATHTTEVTIIQHHRSKSSLIGERNHSAENPGSLNG